VTKLLTKHKLFATISLSKHKTKNFNDRNPHMSIESQPIQPISDEEVNNRIATMEQHIAQPNRGEQIASLIDEVTMKQVPASLEIAEEVAKLLTAEDALVGQEIKANPDLKAGIGKDILDDLRQTAEKGVDNWRLTTEDRATWANVIGSSPNRLSPKMRNFMDSLSPEDKQETDIQKFARLKRQAHDRLSLDAAISDKYDQKPQAKTEHSRRATRPAGASPYATGDGMISVTESDTVVPSGVVRSGKGVEGQSRRATRAAATIEPAAYTEAKNDDAEDINQADEALAADQQADPETSKSKRESLKDLGYLAVASTMTGMTRIGEYFRDRENGKRRSVLVAGAAAVIGAGVAYAAMRNGMSAPNGNRVLEFAQNKPHDVAGKQAALAELQAHTGHGKNVGEHAAKVSKHLSETLPVYNARTGAGTIDHLVADQAHKLGYRITEQQHHALTQQTLNLNKLNWDDARHLPVGFRVNELTPEQIENVLKQKS
jgi:hypothetical protein